MHIYAQDGPNIMAKQGQNNAEVMCNLLVVMLELFAKGPLTFPTSDPIFQAPV